MLLRLGLRIAFSLLDLFYYISLLNFFFIIGYGCTFLPSPIKSRIYTLVLFVFNYFGRNTNMFVETVRVILVDLVQSQFSYKIL